jgi:hypothetical protein
VQALAPRAAGLQCVLTEEASQIVIGVVAAGQGIRVVTAGGDCR